MNAICTQCTAPHRFSTRLTSAPRARARSGYVSPVEIAIVVVLAMLLIVGAVATASGPRSHVSGLRIVRIETGQTLWSIARSNPVPGLTTQQTAELIARTNGLADGCVAAQQSLKVPVASSGRLVALR